MSLRKLALTALAVAGLSAPGWATPQLGEQKFFKDWAVACDNSLSCEAVALGPEGAPFEDRLSLMVGRNSADGGVTITIIGEASKSDRYQLRVDRRVVTSGAMATAGDGSVTLKGPSALKVARALARGREMRLEDEKGALLGNATLRGSAAALRHVDAIQGRAGSSDALVAIGRKRPVGKSLPAPVILAKRIRPDDIVPDATTLVSLTEGSVCAEERNGVTEDRAHSLGKQDGRSRALVLLSCGSGAYNFASAAYIGIQADGGKWVFQPAQFDYGRDVLTMDGSLQLLVNSDWDPATQMLSSYAKGRGLGDCGNSESYVWDGYMFRLVAAHGMSECRGSLDWMQLWRSEVRLVD